MKLTQRQLKNLKKAVAARGAQEALFKIILKDWKRFTLVFLVCAVEYWAFAYLLNISSLAMLWVGFYIGFAVMRVVMIRFWLAHKPLSDEITDWKKVQKIIDEYEQ